jgi:hypothetical protein
MPLGLTRSESRRDSIEESVILFRAQRGYLWRKENVGEENEDEVQDAFPPERMKPNAEFAGDGRGFIYDKDSCSDVVTTVVAATRE